MIKLLIGLILLAIPFLLVGLFRNKKKGFVYVLFFWLLFHACLAVLSQVFGIFYYGVLLAGNLLATAVALVFYFKRKNFKKTVFNFLKLDWLLLVVIVVSFLSLIQVHYNYTGKLSMVQDGAYVYHDVKNVKYVYPYFADEWYAVSLINGAISNHSLPFTNIFDNSFFVNLEMFFHSLLAEFMLFLGLNPLMDYVFVSLFANILIVALVYLFLRINNMSGANSAICSLAMLYLTCCSNLPGLWYLIPVNLGIIFCLIGFCFTSFGDTKMMLLSLLAVFLFYPPLFIFYGLALIVFFSGKLKKAIEARPALISYLIVAPALAVVVLYVLSLIPSVGISLGYLFSKLYYPSFTGNLTPQFNFYYIIPWAIILLAVFGLRQVYTNKKWIFAQLLLGSALWFFYSFYNYRFVIEYERVVFFTSMLVVLISGFGLEAVEKYIGQKFKNIGPLVLKYAKPAVIGLFLVFLPFYTQGDNWESFALKDSSGEIGAAPRAPANNYLTPDDLRIFSSIKARKFLSVAWKGTVIGVSTGNYPVVTKEGTITMGSSSMPDKFLNTGCESKKNIAKEFGLDYIYLASDFSCPGFEKVDKSPEGFILYKFTGN